MLVKLKAYQKQIYTFLKAQGLLTFDFIA